MEKNRPLTSPVYTDKAETGETPDAGITPATETEKLNQEPETTTPPETQGQEPEPDTAEQQSAKAFKTWEDAEKSYAELRREYSRSQNEKAEMERRIRQIEETQRAEKQWADTSAKLREITAAEYKKAVQAVNQLDPDAEDYTEKYAQIQADRDFAIRNAERSLVRQEPERPSAPSPEPDVSVVRNELQAMLKEAQLEADDPIVQGYLHTQSATDSKGRILTPQQQMAEVIRKTKDYQTKLAGKTRQAVSNPLHRTGPGKPETKTPEQAQNVPLGSYWKH